MLDLADALNRVEQAIEPLNRVETIPTSQALGRYSSSSVYSNTAIPPFRRAVMDGYAVNQFNVALPIVGQSFAGQPYTAEPQISGALKVSTGAVVPGGFECVVPQELCRQDGDRVICQKPDQRWIRDIGDDISRGQLLVEPGQRFNLGHLAALRTQAIEQVEVSQRPKLRLFVTGNEVTQPSEPLDTGQVYDVHGQVLPALLARHQMPISIEYVQDDLSATKAALSADFDLALTTGGASVGQHDYVREALDDVDFFRVKMQPGRPVALGWASERPVLVLPGNPSSAWVTALWFVLPALARLQGGKWRPKGIPITVASSIQAASRRRLLRASVTDAGVKPVSNQDSGRVWPWAVADGLLEIPEELTLNPGDNALFYPFEGLW